MMVGGADILSAVRRPLVLPISLNGLNKYTPVTFRVRRFQVSKRYRLRRIFGRLRGALEGSYLKGL